MVEPVSWSSAIAAKYGPTVVGLVIGTAAKYGLTLSEGKPVTLKGVVADVLLLGILGFIAIFIADMAGRMFGLEVSDDVRVLTGSLAAVSSDRLVRLAREYFLRRAESDLARAINLSPATSAELPAGTGEPAAIAIQGPVEDSPHARAAVTLKGAFDRTTRERPPVDHIDALRRLDRAPPPR